MDRAGAMTVGSSDVASCRCGYGGFQYPAAMSKITTTTPRPQSGSVFMPIESVRPGVSPLRKKFGLNGLAREPWTKFIGFGIRRVVAVC